MLRGVSGIYAYGIFEREAWPAFGMPNARLAFKLQRNQYVSLFLQSYNDFYLYVILDIKSQSHVLKSVK